MCSAFEVGGRAGTALRHSDARGQTVCSVGDGLQEVQVARAEIGPQRAHLVLGPCAPSDDSHRASDASMSIVDALLASRSPRPPLHPSKPWRDDAAAQIEALDVPLMAKAALFVINDDLDSAHAIVQDREGEGLSNGASAPRLNDD